MKTNYFLALLLSTTVVALADAEEDSVFLWSSTGGGWRAMCACMGYANAFRQAGLFDQDSSKFRSIATNSGASWFNTQLFYSQAFYDQVVMAPTTEDLYEFTLLWMDTYHDMVLEYKSYLEENITNALGELGLTPTPAPTTAPPNITLVFTEHYNITTSQELEEFLQQNNLSSTEELEAFIDAFAKENNLSTVEEWEVFLTEEYSIDQYIGSDISNIFPPEDDGIEDENEPFTFLVEFFDVYMAANASWAYFYDDMMTRATQAYGHEGDFASIVANAENRLPPMQTTEMVLQTTISPSSKVRLASANFNYTALEDNYGDTALNDEWAYLKPVFGELENQDMEVFLGPLRNDQMGDGTIEDWDLYSIGVSSYYLVNDTHATFQYATHDSNSTSTMASYVAPTHQHFNWNNFEGWYLYPNTGFWGQPTDPPLAVMKAIIPAQYNPMTQNMTSTGTMKDAFGGAATVIQSAATSSAVAAPASPACPPVFAQALSRIRQQFIQQLDPAAAVLSLTAFDLTVQNLYKNALLDDGAVCSQWPNPCGPTDGYFMDGAFSDNPSVASNVAQYQNSADADLKKTIKLVLTNTNQNYEPASYDQYLQYFETAFNQNVTPGGYLWVPNFSVPYRSPQIFGDYLSEEALLGAIEPIAGSNMTTAILKATTTVNPAFGTKAGQPVEILLINTNSGNITTFIVGTEIITALREPIADMTAHIAGNQILVQRVQDFFFGGDSSSEDASDVEAPAEPEAGGNETLPDAADNDAETPAVEEETPADTGDGAEISRAGPVESTSAAVNRLDVTDKNWMTTLVVAAMFVWRAQL